LVIVLSLIIRQEFGLPGRSPDTKRGLSTIL
jgi:hypothetical protein